MSRLIFCFSLAAPLFVGCAKPVLPPDSARADIADAWAAFKTAWVAGNVHAATAAFFTADAINTVPDAPDARGRAAIDSSFATFLATTKIVSINQSTEEVEASGDLAYERGTFEQTTQQGQAAPQTARGRYIAVWKRQPDGKFMCHRYLFNYAPRSS